MKLLIFCREGLGNRKEVDLKERLESFLNVENFGEFLLCIPVMLGIRKKLGRNRGEKGREIKWKRKKLKDHPLVLNSN